MNLEHYATDGRFVENLDRAMALMYRPITEKAHGHYHIRNYTIDEAKGERCACFMPMTIVGGTMVFLEYRGELRERFAVLFTAVEQSEGKREFKDKWGWYRVM